MNGKLSKAIKLRSGGSCEARVACRRSIAVHMHHRRRASRVDSRANLLHVCLKCHDWIHANPERSYELGLLVHSWDDPVEVAVESSGGLPWFTDPHPPTNRMPATPNASAAAADRAQGSETPPSDSEGSVGGSIEAVAS